MVLYGKISAGKSLCNCVYICRNVDRQCMQKGSVNVDISLKDILKNYVKDVAHIYGNQLKSIILYGSYARGDYREDSDVDIMILVDLTDEEIKEKGQFLSDLTFDYNFDNDLEIMPIVKNKEHFYKWIRSYPFYNNIQKEGVQLYAGY